MNREVKYDLVIVGAGSGGIGAAITAGRLGLRTLLVEKSPCIGGNAAVSGVSVWEMGAGGTGIPFEIYKRLKRIPEAVGIYEFNRHCAWKDAGGRNQFPAGALLTINPRLKYLDSLTRHGARSLAEDEAFVRKNWHGVPFEPEQYQKVVEEMILETGRVEILKGTAFEKLSHDGSRLYTLRLSGGEEVAARYFIDATESGVLCQAAGCHMLFGQESRQMFDEPDAPEVPSPRINGVSLIYRIAPREDSGIDPLPESVAAASAAAGGGAETSAAAAGEAAGGAAAECWWADRFPLASLVQYPNGDFNVNMLPTMDGVDYMAWDKDTVWEECRKRSLAHWHYLQRTYPMFRKYTRVSEFRSLGVRESKRVVGEYVLTERDLLAGLQEQGHPDIIAVADHPMDTHGASTGRSGCVELPGPYGVPFRCLIPQGFDNLLIASRGASFSSLAASSCRLSRTMMQLGQAAATAVALAKRSAPAEAGTSASVETSISTSASASAWPSLRALDPRELRGLLDEQHVQMQEHLTERQQKYLAEE